MEKINLLAVIPNTEDATSFYRAIGPLGQLRKIMPELNIISGVQRFTWAVMQMSDIVFLQGGNADVKLTADSEYISGSIKKSFRTIMKIETMDKENGIHLSLPQLAIIK